MTHPTEIKIPNDSIITEFKEHLDVEFNQRILFTAPFGAGKSTFINDFEDQYKNEYRFIRLYPVNYAVSGNEDIFELIKFDVLYELMNKYLNEIDLQKEGFSLKLKNYMFLRYNLDRKTLITSLLALGGEIGKPISEIVKMLWNTYDEFNKFNEVIKIDELKFIEDVFSSSEAVIGSTYENDSLSKFLYELIDRLKGAVQDRQDVNIELDDLKKEYKTVLVIDDLDRLDPDHIFRLFNIFSAHTHAVTGENKFGFDKILFVCDIENIRKIYAHKYGEGVDFSGYMDKFYSIRPFIYDNFKYLQEKIVTIINRSTFKDQEQEEIAKQNSVVVLLTTVLKILSKNKVINLRSLLKSSDFVLTTSGNVTVKGIVSSKTDIKLYIVFGIISEMLGGWSQLEKALILVKDNSHNQRYTDYNYNSYQKYRFSGSNNDNELDFLFQEIFRVFVVEHLRNDTKTTNKDKIISFNDFGLDLIYSLVGEDIKSFRAMFIRESGNIDTLKYNINYDLLLIESFKKLKEYGCIANY
ncbi:P-loop NTPase fold protein [Myroides odoratus]|uniref:P-loop NTPase fold protein n=1 Tax=Myroides odoratus TaxID=256 RepID=UPI000765A202|nr:P-loop NTPase fold protein [Myroides odoratus]